MPRDSFPRKGQQRPWRHRRRLLGFWKIEVVDDINEQQRDLRFVRSASVKIWISRRHGITKRGGSLAAPSL
jgi:hypothetical protein